MFFFLYENVQDVDGIKKAMEKLKQSGDLSDEETEKLLGAMTTLEENVKKHAKESFNVGVANGGSGEMKFQFLGILVF